MTTAYLDGIHHAMYAVAWLAGALTIAAAVAALPLLLLLVLGPTWDRVRTAYTRHQLRRAHARSGRTTGHD